MFSNKAGRIVPLVAVTAVVLAATLLALRDRRRAGDEGKPAGIARTPSEDARLQLPVGEAGDGAVAGGDAKAAVKAKAEVWRMARTDSTGGQAEQGGDVSGGWRRVETEVKLSSAELPKAPAAQPGTPAKATAHGEGFVSITHAYPSFEIVGGRGGNGGWSGFKPPRKMRLSDEPGKPALPVAPVQLLLPPREDIVEIVVVPGKLVELPGTYRIEPAAAPVPIGKPEDARPPEPDPKVYGSDELFPGRIANVLGTQYKMGHGIAVLTLNPVQYRPKSGKVLAYESLSVVVRTKVPPVPSTRILPRKEDAGEVGKLIDNPEVLERYGAAIDGGQFGEFQPLGSLVDPADSYPYVIITTSAFKNATTDYKLQDIVTLRTSEGLAATIVTTEDIYANYTGVDNPEKIRNFIIDARNGWETQYVLIVGDSGVVAYRSLWGDAGSYSRNIPSDLYYGCLDGNYNYDGDGTWGEANDGPGGGLPDFLYEVYVGRASAQNEAEMSNFVYKTITYEVTDELDAYRYRAIMAGEQLDASTPGDWSMENLITGKYGSVGLAAYVTPYRLYDSEKDDQGPGAWNKSHLIALMNSNKYSMIHHLGHSNTTYNMRMGNGDADALTNTKFFVVYSQGCYPGDFPNDCIAEHFTTSTRNAAVAGVWNSVYGWYNPGSDDGLSQKFHREFVDAVFGHGKYRAAVANAHSKEAWNSSMSSGYMRWIAYAENLFGDPALKLPNYTTLPMPCIDSTTFTDNVVGNNDGIINAGETVDLEVVLKNNGQSGTTGVNAVLSSPSSYVTIVTSSASFGNMPAGSTATGTPKYRFSVGASCPTNTALPFTLTITDSASRTWVREFKLYCYTSCTISGKVTDQGTGAGISGATVSYTGPISGSVSTASDGSYMIEKLIDGTYSLTASHPSYQSKTVTGQVLPPSRTVNFALVYPNIVVPATLTASCAPGASTTTTLPVQNTGTATLIYGVFQAGNNQGKKIATLPAAAGYNQRMGLAWAPDGLWRSVYNSSAAKYQFIRQDVSSGMVLQVLDIPAGVTGTPYGLAWDGTYLWIGTSAPRVYRVNPSDGTVAANFAVTATPYDMAWDGANLWVLYYYSVFTVAKYNTSGSKLSSFNLASGAYALDWDGSALWVGTYANPGKYAAYDTSGNKLYEFSSADGQYPYYGLAWDGSHFWVSSFSEPIKMDSGRVSWLAPYSKTGTVAAKSSSNITYTFDAAGLSPGTYTTKLKAASNDIETPLLDIAVTFTVVSGPNTPPTISDIPNQVTNEDTPTGAIPFTVNDNETPAASLVVTGTSSNTTLVPNGNIVFGGSGNSRTVTITPAANQYGTTTITVTVTDGGGLTASDTFTLTVNAVNDPPTISNIPDQSTNQDTPKTVSFMVGDIDNDVNILTLSGTSSNTALLPNGNISFGGSGASRTVTLTPAAGQTGSTTVTITVSDGSLTAGDSFVLTVAPVGNTPPTISDIPDQTTNEDTPVGPIAFIVGDDGDPAALTLTGTSSNTTLVPNGNIVFGGSGAGRTVTITPAANQYGTTTITVTVRDPGGLTASDTFVLTVNAVNDPPTISDIPNQVTNEDTPTGAIPFTVNDTDDDPAALTVTGTSSNTTLVPNGNIVFGGSGTGRTVTITPAANQYGTTTITVTVRDPGGLTASDTFTLTVNPINDPPTISDMPDQTTNEDTPIGPIAFTVGDIDNDPAALTVTGTSSNAVLVPSANIVFGGSGTGRTVTITPAPNRFGVTVITVTVRDPGGLTASDTFVLTVNPVNDPPVANGQSVTTAEDTPAAITLSASDADGDPLTYIVVGGPSHGTLSGAAPNLVYTPDANWFGNDSFTFKASDGTADSNVATVNITVTEVNDPPTATASASPTDGIAPLPVFFTGDGSDVDGDPLTFSWDFGDGTSAAGKNPTHIYTAGGIYTVTLTVSDGRGGVATATLTITVANAEAMNITKLKILREFEGKKRLLIKVAGDFVVPERVPAEGTNVRLDVGGVAISGTMDGKGRISTEEFRFRFKPSWLKLIEDGRPKWVTAYGPAKFKATIGGNSEEWGDEFEDEGLTKGAGLTSPMVRVWLRLGNLSYGGLYKGEWMSTESRGVFK